MKNTILFVRLLFVGEGWYETFVSWRTKLVDRRGRIPRRPGLS